MTSPMCSLNICPCNPHITEWDAPPDVTAQMGQAALRISLNVYMYSPVMTTAALGKRGRMILESGSTVCLRDLGGGFSI